MSRAPPPSCSRYREGRPLLPHCAISVFRRGASLPDKNDPSARVYAPLVDLTMFKSWLESSDIIVWATIASGAGGSIVWFARVHRQSNVVV